MRRKRVFDYLRVSAIDQETEKNKAEILTFANTKKFGCHRSLWKKKSAG